MAPVGAQDVQQMRVLELFRLGELEDDPLQRKARLQGGGQRRPGAGFRFIDGIWQEIDGQQAARSGDPRIRSELDRLLAGTPDRMHTGCARRSSQGCRQHRVHPCREQVLRGQRRFHP